MPQSSRDRDRDRERHHRAHRSTDSGADLLPNSQSPSRTKQRHRRKDEDEEERRRRRRERRREERRVNEREEQRTMEREEREMRNRTKGQTLNMASLAALDALNDAEEGTERVRTRKVREVAVDEDDEERRREERRRRRRKEEMRRRREEDEAGRRGKEKRRVVSGTFLERGSEEDKEGREWRLRQRGGAASDAFIEEDKRKKRRRLILALILVVAIPVGVTISKKDSNNSTSSPSADSSAGKPSNSNLNGISQDSIPASAKGTYLDPFTWYDTTDFNVTYTNQTVGGLPVMGLNSSWDDSTKANDNVPALNEVWQYGTTPIRGINLGGWLSIEPVITPSLFSPYTTRDNVVDEWTLCQKLGNNAKAVIEQHYSSFVNEATFQEMQAAGFDHVRIPFSYWAVTTYSGDPYVAQVSWRYLLRAIEWARKYGLRINLDLHGAPGSQNGWNHSGHQGQIGWLNGTDGQINADRTTDIHDQLSTFFAQPRYKNIIAIYGLVNEPRMTFLDTTAVLGWTTKTVNTVRNNNITALIAFGDGFMGLANWQGKLQNLPNLILDVHQYVIFNVEQITLNHHNKTNFACAGWTAQSKQSMNRATGFGPTICGEWSQADTDCAQYLNNVGVGSRWEGTLNMANTPGGSTNQSVLSPTCPTANNPICSCEDANADPANYSPEYKTWLLQFAEAQMRSFEYGWGWFYWTWKTETATQWSYRDGLAAGILPQKTWERSFDCANIPDYAAAGLPENY
ncbi:hypothetical protein MBLNU457_4555t1 [Dothideomycetes sp. NU457]